MSLVSLLLAPIRLALNPAFSSFTDLSEVNRQLPLIMRASVSVILLTILAISLFVVGTSIPSLGTVQLEQGLSAVLVHHLGVSAALQRAWGLVQKNFGVMTLMSLINYLVAIVLIIISIPMMISTTGFISNLGSETEVQSFERLSRNVILWTLTFLPFYAVLQGGLLTLVQSVWTLTYLRLTRSSTLSQPLPGTMEGTS